MLNLYNNDTGALLGQISEAELKTLIQNLEEESAADQDYYIMADTVDLLAARGADARLVELLRTAIGDQEGIEICWSPS
jgi:hypothetical protein